MLNFRRFTLLVIAWFLAFCVVAQKEANNWYFGNNAAFHFNTLSGNPVAISGSAMKTLEGCSSISDRTTGRLLFYTDGRTVYNRNNVTMTNGTGLQGHSSSSHSSVVVPFPGNKNKYYIFTVPTNANVGAKYSVVDMTQSSGLGAVSTTQKNIQLAQSPTNTMAYPVADKCAAIGHSNGRDYWVVVQHNTSWSFYAYLVTSSGVSNTPVISTITPISLSGRIPHYGCMKISPDAKKLVTCYASLQTFALFDFNSRTGAVTNQISVNNGQLDYGVEFSPDSKLLYVNGRGVRQYNPFAGTASQINTSGVLVSSTGMNLQGQLQLGPDLKIYWSKLSFSAGSVVSRIDSPNVSGLGCAFRDTGVVLTSSAVARLGLPTFVQSFFTTTTLEVKDACDSSWVKISVKDTAAVDSVLYVYGDTASKKNSSWNKLDSHIFSQPGKFEVIAYAFYTDKKGKVVRDTLRDTIEVLQVPIVQLPNDTTICVGDSVPGLILNPQYSSPSERYWQDSSQNVWYQIDTIGKFYMSATNRCGTGSDTMYVDSLFKRSFDLGNDTVICLGDSLVFDISDTSATYLWSTGDTTPVYVADST
ncbi:MAG: hypothetical protein CL840_19965, partial [Crocinitomicaceae bacterium]|nr:hypothetical protein [Crocinitomicaceae bacterium]